MDLKMGDFNFNTEERDLIAAFSRDRRSMWSILGSYANDPTARILAKRAGAYCDDKKD
jgi:hypothetical protein